MLKYTYEKCINKKFGEVGGGSVFAHDSVWGDGNFVCAEYYLGAWRYGRHDRQRDGK